MARYIDADSLIEQFSGGEAMKSIAESIADERFVREIRATPTADVQEVRHGRWIKVRELSPRYVCDCCRHLYNNMGYKYCPNCGAKMDGDSNA